MQQYIPSQTLARTWGKQGTLHGGSRIIIGLSSAAVSDQCLQFPSEMGGGSHGVAQPSFESSCNSSWSRFCSSLGTGILPRSCPRFHLVLLLSILLRLCLSHFAFAPCSHCLQPNHFMHARHYIWPLWDWRRKPPLFCDHSAEIE